VLLGAVALAAVFASTSVFASMPRGESFAPPIERFAFENAPRARLDATGVLPLVDQLRRAAVTAWPRRFGYSGSLVSDDGKYVYNWNEKEQLVAVTQKPVTTASPIRRIRYYYDLRAVRPEGTFTTRRQLRAATGWKFRINTGSSGWWF
jgi:hypothetical protein